MPTVENVIFDLKFKVGGAQASLSSVSSKLADAEKKFQGAKKGTREYIQAQKELKSINEEIAGSFDTVNRRASSFGDKMKSAAKGIGGLVAIGSVTAIMRDGVQQIIAYDDALADLSAITGATGGDLEFYKQKALEVGATTTISAQQAVQAFKLIGSAKPELLQSKEALVEVADAAVILAQASRLELPAAADALTTVMNQFNLTAADSASIIDGLANGSLKGAADIPTLTETIQKSGTVMAQNNITFQEGIALTETLADKQLKGAEAGTALRGVILKLTKSGKGFVDGQFDITAALEQTKTELESISDPAERANAAINLFGQEGITAGNILLGNIDRFKELTVAMDESGTATDQAAINAATLAGGLDRLKTAYSSVVLSIQGSEKAGKFITFLADNFPKIVKAVKRGAIAFAAYKTVIILSSNVTKVMTLATKAAAFAKGLFTGATKTATFSMKAFNTAVKSNPIGLLVAVLSTAIAFMFDYGDATDEAAAAESNFAKKVRETNEALKLRKAVEKDTSKASIKQIEDVIAAYETSLQNISTDTFDPLAKFGESTNEGAVTVSRYLKDIIAEIETQNPSKDLRAAFGSDDFLKVDLKKVKENITTLKETILVNIEKLKKDLETAKKTIDVTTTITPTSTSTKGNESLLQEQQRHAVAIAQIEKKSSSDILKIRLDFAKKALKELQSSNDTTTKKLLNQKNIIDELGRKLENTKQIDTLKSKIEDTRTALLSGNVNGGVFSETLTDYISLTKELKTVTDSTFSSPDSINALSNRVSQLKKLATNTDLSTSSFELLKDALLQAQIDLQKAQNELKPVDLVKLANSDLSEEERHQGALSGIRGDGELDRLNITIAFAKAKLQVLKDAGQLETDQAQKLNNQITELEETKINIKKDAIKEQQDLDAQNKRELTDHIFSEVAATQQAVDQIIQIRISEIDRLIQLQSERVNRAQKIADKGNAEVLEAEQDRLNALNKQRESFVKKQQALIAIQLIAETALTVARAAAEGGTAAAFTIAAALAALVAGLASARSIAGQASYFKGGYTGDGSPYGVSNKLGNKSYEYHNKEFVMDHAVTGIGNNKAIFQHILDHRVDLSKYFGQKMVVVNNNQDQGIFKEIKKSIDKGFSVSNTRIRKKKETNNYRFNRKLRV